MDLERREEDGVVPAVLGVDGGVDLIDMAGVDELA